MISDDMILHCFILYHVILYCVLLHYINLVPYMRRKEVDWKN